MMSVSATVTGHEELARKLKLLDLSKQQKAIKAAGRYAFKPVLDDARANVPVDTGLLRDQMRIVSRTSAESVFPLEVGITFKEKVRFEDLEGAIALVQKYRSPNARSRTVQKRDLKRAKGKKHRILLDAGWRWHFIETGMPARGIPARPFLRPALARNKDAVDLRFRERLAQLVERLAKS